MENKNPFSKYNIKVRIGYKEIKDPLNSLNEVKEAVQENNQRVSLEGLEKELNPEILDFEKVMAFLKGFSKLSGKTIEEMKGKTIYLNSPSSLLGTSSPIEASKIGEGYSLSFSSEQDRDLLHPVMAIEIDQRKAKDLLADAKRKAEELDEKVKDAEKQVSELKEGSEDLPLKLRELSLLKSKRFAVSLVWKQNADLLGDPEELGKAEKAVSDYVVAPWSGMPEK